jgi:hypothetical protein
MMHEGRNGANEVFLLPLAQQQGIAGNINKEPGLINASFSRQIYTISVARSSNIFFAVFTLAILLWCLTVMILSGFNRTPEDSAYFEMDIVGRLPIKDEERRDLLAFQSRLYENGPSGVVKALRGVRLIVNEEAKVDDREGIELQDK